MISNRFVSRFFFHWYEKLCSLAVPLGVREPWKKAVITCTGWNFTFFVVFQCLECRLNCWSCMSSFFSGLRQWVFFPMFAHSFTSIFPFFSFLKIYFLGAVPIHTAQTIPGKGGKHVVLASFQLNWLHIIVIWIPVLLFLHFHLSFFTLLGINTHCIFGLEERVGMILLST